MAPSGQRPAECELSTQRDDRLAFQAYLPMPSAESETSTSAWFLRSDDGAYRDTLVNPASRAKPQLLESIGPTRYSALSVPFSPVAVGAFLVAVSTPSVWSDADTSARSTDPNAMPPRTFAERLTFDVYGEDGTYRGRLALPADAQLHATRGQDACGSVPDEAGEQYLVRWRIGG